MRIHFANVVVQDLVERFIEKIKAFRKMSGFSQIVNMDGHLLHTMTVNIVDFLRIVEVSRYKIIIIVAHFLVWGSEKIL